MLQRASWCTAEMSGGSYWWIGRRNNVTIQWGALYSHNPNVPHDHHGIFGRHLAQIQKALRIMVCGAWGWETINRQPETHVS
jgi:hypothetical protein